MWILVLTPCRGSLSDIFFQKFCPVGLLRPKNPLRKKTWGLPLSAPKFFAQSDFLTFVRPPSCRKFLKKNIGKAPKGDWE
jgi:hypothetical protein